ncbi:MAG TPA: 2Fe-2S iron-sulfur cluster-binding protein [Pyrinomonadaceae bacterium]|jgi:ferredoxin|nr:2Fe-2S iron-sulfur cluster-binding protein [Pyrinomonadaceae bacterium]
MVEKKQVEVQEWNAGIRFEPEGIEGLIAEGTYLSEAANRFGIYFEGECGGQTSEAADGQESHCCAVLIEDGGELLSAPTQDELDNLSEEARSAGQRLACQARIERTGEVIVAIMEKEEEMKDETVVQEEKFQEFRKGFSDLPLNQKVGELMQLEAITLGETFAYVLNLPFTIGDQIMGVMAGFGKQMDKAAEEAKRPKEHTADQTTAQTAEEQNGASEG